MVKFIKINNKQELIESKMVSLDELFKNCGFRKNDDFVLLKEIKFNKFSLQFYGKNKGRIININKYTFNNEEIVGYGSIAVLKVVDNEIIDFSKILMNEIILSFNEKVNECNTSKSNDNINENNEYNDNNEDSESEYSSSDEELNSELEPDEYLFSSDEEKN